MVGDDAAYARLASPTDIDAVVRPRVTLPMLASALPDVSPARSPIGSPAEVSPEEVDEAPSCPAAPRASARTLSNAAPDAEVLLVDANVPVDTVAGSNRDTMALIRAWTSTGIVTEPYRQVPRTFERIRRSGR